MAVKSFNRYPLILLDGKATTTGASTWGSDIDKVGVVVLGAAGTLTFDSTNYPADFGGSIIHITNDTASAIDVTITPDPHGDATAPTEAVAAGDMLAVVYHPTYGFLFLSND